MSKNSERVRKAWLKSGLTYNKLATLVNVKRNTLACWITGRREPSDIVTNFIEERVNFYLNGVGAYVDKNKCRNRFAQAISKVVSDEQVKEIMNIYDSLPTVNLNNVQ